MAKKIYLYGNWKMNMLKSETEAFFKALPAALEPFAGRIGTEVEIAVFPTFTSLWAAGDATATLAHQIIVGAQDVYFEPKGAFTGEISADMIKEAGATHVIIGHSERRHILMEPDELIAKKTRAALDAGLTPVLCYGETLDEREADKQFEVMERQLKSAVEGLSPEAIARIIYAYEPVWAIGTGKTATPEQAEEVCAWSRKLLCKLAGKDMPLVILYGGSVKGSNAKDLLGSADIDGALVGGASLKPDTFLDIFAAYSK